MMYRFYVMLLALALLPAGLGCQADSATPDQESQSTSGVETQTVHGVIKAITPSRAYVNIDHEAIPGFMEAMSMFFTVKDSTVLQGVSVSDSVLFTVEINRGDAIVVDIQVIE